MIENKIGETGEPCGIACVKGWGDSQLLSKLNDSVRFEVKPFVQLMRHVGVRKIYVSICKIQIFHLYVICVFRATVATFTPLSLPQHLKKIHVYIREILNYLYFRILTHFNFF
jgi:hypothetical protein